MSYSDQQLAHMAEQYVDFMSGSEIIDAIRIHASLIGLNLRFVKLTGLEITVVHNVFRVANAANKMEALLHVIALDGLKMESMLIRSNEGIIQTNLRLKIESFCNYIPTNPFILASYSSLIEGWITNPSQHPQQAILKIYISGFADIISLSLTIPSGTIQLPHIRFPQVTRQEGENITSTLSPSVLNCELYTVDHITPVDIFQGNILVTQPDFILIGRNVDEQRIEDYSYLLAWVINSGAKGIDTFLSSKVFPHVRDNFGYRISLPENAIAVEKQIRYVYEALKELDIKFLPTEILQLTDEQLEIIQRVQTPDAILVPSSNIRYANCLDGAILFASLLERMNLSSVLILLPGHALVGWKKYPTTLDLYSYEQLFTKCGFIDTTLLSSNLSFEAAQSAAEGYLLRYKDLLNQPPKSLTQFASVIDTKTARTQKAVIR